MAPMRDGTALLLVLIGIAALSMATMTIAAHATSRVRQLRLDRLEDQCEVLRADAEYAAGVWLHEHGAAISTPLADPYRPTTVIDSEVTWDSRQVHILVQAWDALSSIPQPNAGSPIALPTDIRCPEKSEPETWWLSAVSDERPRFPLWQDASNPPPSPHTLPPLALACSALSGQRVNWRTAPWDVVTALIPAPRQSDLIGILRAGREDRQVISIPDDARRTAPPYLVDASDRWCLNVQIQIGDLRKQWFLLVAQQSGAMATVVRYAQR